MTPDEAVKAAEVRADALRRRYLAHDPAVSFAEWRTQAAEARRLREERGAVQPVLQLVRGGAA